MLLFLILDTGTQMLLFILTAVTEMTSLMDIQPLICQNLSQKTNSHYLASPYRLSILDSGAQKAIIRLDSCDKHDQSYE